jgi:ethanolamine utilization microcompartment shell protein EutS
MLPVCSGGERLGIPACIGYGPLNLRFSAALLISGDAGKVESAIKQRAVTYLGRCLNSTIVKNASNRVQ